MLHVITGPPCSGKSTYARENARDGDVIVDFDAMATALGSKVAHGSTGAIRLCAYSARKSAIERALLECRGDGAADAWIIHSYLQDDQIKRYERAGAEFVAMDTPMDECIGRCRGDGRPDGTEDEIRRWFAEGEKQGGKMKYKSFKASIDEESGKICGYVSTWDREPDCYNDVVKAGAFGKSLERWAESECPVPLLFGHNTGDPFYNIGACDVLKEDERGLYVEAYFDDSETAQRVRKLSQEGRIKAFSFGYEVIQQAQVTLENGQKVNELQEINIFEVSVVTLPANSHAEVTDVKSMGEGEDGDDVVIGKALVDIVPRVKAGRVLSKRNADDLKQAISLIQGVVDQLGEDDDTGGGDGDEGKSAEAGDGNAAVKSDRESTLSKIDKILKGEV